MKKLLPTTPFILWLENDNETCDVANKRGYIEFKSIIISYAKLMQLKPELGMFVPCVNGKPIEQPRGSQKERVLFEGWKSITVNYTNGAIKGKLKLQFHNSGTTNLWVGGLDKVVRNIEDLVRATDLTPTKTLLKEIGL